MAHLRINLYGKVLLWFMVNLAVLAILGCAFMRMQFRLSFDWMLAGPGGERIERMAESLGGELRRTPESDWERVLSRYQMEVGTVLALFGNDGVQRVGQVLQVPSEVRPRLINRRLASDMAPPFRGESGDKTQSPREQRLRSEGVSNPTPKPRFMLRTNNPTLYWAGMDLTVAHGEGESRRPITLVIVSESLTAGGLFFNPWPWAGLAAVALVLSAIVWLPFVGSVTRDIRCINDAARKVAQGFFDVRLPAGSRDELGELAVSVNDMARQLIDYVEQQRRITRDVAHELCSPIARLQMALGVIEQRANPELSAYIEDLDSELQQMAKLVEEILAFSKAQSLPDRNSPEDIDLEQLVQTVISREAEGLDVQVSLPADLRLFTLRDAVDRSLGNVLRNAVRYAGRSGTISISAEKDLDKALITVADEGPGVPAEALPRLFETFFRPEAARERDTGGSGLGLAIVKRCVEICGGTVYARNRDPHGLEVSMTFPLRSTGMASSSA